MKISADSDHEGDVDYEVDYRPYKHLCRPTEQDLYLYKNYRHFGLALDGTRVVDLPPHQQLREIQLSTTGPIVFGGKYSCSIKGYENGQIDKIYMRVSCSDPEGQINGLDKLIESVEYVVEGQHEQKIQSYNGRWLGLYNNLEQPHFLRPIEGSEEIWVPLPLTFHQPGPFPMDQLGSCPLRLTVKFAELTGNKDNIKLLDAHIYVEEHYPNPFLVSEEDECNGDDVNNGDNVDNGEDSGDESDAEDKQLSPTNHLWEQVQIMNPVLVGSNRHRTIDLKFYGPVKSLIWNFSIIKHDSIKGVGAVDFPSLANLIDTAEIRINGDVLIRAPGTYFHRVNGCKFGGSQELDPSVYSYHFAAEPTSARPTGTRHFNPLSQVQLCLDMTKSADIWGSVQQYGNLYCHIHAICYNVLQLDEKHGAGFLFTP